MTFRSILLGLFGASAVCGLSYLNDQVLRQTFLVGNNMPVSVYGALIVFVVCINPLLRKMSFTGRELAVALALTLAACCVPGSGLLRTFTNSLILPYHYVKTEPAWQEKNVLDLTPPKMLADITRDEDTVLTGFVQGLGEPNKHISPGQVPWYGWGRTLLFWVPLILTLWLALMALSLVVHRQWADYEHLPYPVAEFANSLLPSNGGRKPGVFSSRLFWIAAGCVLLIHLNNFIYRWYPNYLVEFPVRFDFTRLAYLSETFIRGGGARLFFPTVYFSVIGLSYFLASDVAFSMGIGPFLWALVAGVLAGWGITLNGVLEGAAWYTALKLKAFLLFGAYLGFFGAMLYLGRHYYLGVAKKVVGLGARHECEPQVVWGGRIFAVLSLCFVVQLMSVGLTWPQALAYTFLTVLFFVMMSRIMAETGLFYIQPYWFPCGVLWGIVGADALGLRTMMILFTLSAVLVIDPRESVMPFMVNSLKVLDLRRVRLGRSVGFGMAALLVGLAIALPLTLYLQYDLGCSLADGWAAHAVPRMQYENIVSLEQRLTAQGKLAVDSGMPAPAGAAAMSPNVPCLIAGGIGLVLVLLASAARLRFTWWFLHPVLFATWATEPQWRLCGAFLVGWVIKTSVMHYGGASMYQRLKPLMIGLIAGEVLGAIVPSLVGVIYYWQTGEPPPSFLVMPG